MIDFYKIEKEWEKEISCDDFIKEFTRENPDVVRESRIEFLQKKLDRQIEKNLWWLEILLSIRVDWFKEAVKDYFILGMKKAGKIQREIGYYKNPQSFKTENNLASEEIEQARQVDCSEFLEVKRRGNKGWALCPFHKEKTPSFCCYEGGKGFYCYGCGKGGDTISLVMELYGMKFKEAVNFINKK